MWSDLLVPLELLQLAWWGSELELELDVKRSSQVNAEQNRLRTPSPQTRITSFAASGIETPSPQSYASQAIAGIGALSPQICNAPMVAVPMFLNI